MLFTLYLAGIVLAVFICMVMYRIDPTGGENPFDSFDLLAVIIFLWPLVLAICIIIFSTIIPMWWSAGKVANLLRIYYFKYYIAIRKE